MGGPDRMPDGRGMNGPPPPGGGPSPGMGRGMPPPPRPGTEYRGPDGPLRYESRDYGDYVRPPNGNDYAELQDELAELRKENKLLKSSCQDLLNSLNELSNRLFDVDESLKKVAKIFPEEDELNSLEWLLRR